MYRAWIHLNSLFRRISSRVSIFLRFTDFSFNRFRRTRRRTNAGYILCVCLNGLCRMLCFHYIAVYRMDRVFVIENLFTKSNGTAYCCRDLNFVSPDVFGYCLDLNS